MINLLKVIDLGNDVLEVTGFESDNPTQIITAHGWVSAITNHYDADDYSENGDLKEDATPREMTDKEKNSYWIGLLQEKNGSSESIFENTKAIKEHEKAVKAAEEAAKKEAESSTKEATDKSESK